MKLTVLISACLLSFALASCSSSNDSPDGTTGSTTNAFGATDESTAGTDSTDGTYVIDVELNPNQGPECEETGGEMVVDNNVITGTVVNPTDQSNLNITGQIQTDGTISGGFAFSGGSSFATYTGSVISTGDFEGDWEDEFGCIGTWAAVKN